MNILYIGKFYSKRILETIVEDTKGAVQFSNHNFEMSLIRGLSQQSGVTLRVLSAPMVYSYPQNNRNLYIKESKYKEGEISFRSIGFFNLIVFNKISIIRNLSRAIVEELNHFNDDEVKVIVNTPTLELSYSVFNAIRKSNKNVSTVLIVPDIPECMLDMDGQRSIKYRIVKWLNQYNTRLSKLYDKYVYLTEDMNDFYKSDKKNYIVMEGLMDESRIPDSYKSPEYQSGKEIILYTGTLRKIFGVMNLLDAFEKADLKNAELWICGSGECTSLIQERANLNPKIKFWGLVSSDEALRLQAQATILANPRSANGKYTKYSFPSKTIEYLLAGRTVIMNRLSGIPFEYNQFICYPDDESIESWALKLREITTWNSMSRLQMSENGRLFILNNKTARQQCSRIVKLCEKH